MTRVIGLTGGIASGKSSISKILQALGAIIIDADIIARRIVEKGKPAFIQIEATFGKEYITNNGELDRKKLGAYVFNNNLALKKLNSITHPFIIKEIESEIKDIKKKMSNGVIVLDAALLIEMELMSLVDEVWIVEITAEEQLRRLMLRDKLSLQEAKARINSQMSFEEKKKYADKIIDNSASFTELKEVVESVLKKVKVN
ncbi:dephospho-CoA kinase [Alkaliphilus peptidifermentans]|uniref:Dephospho-CoA kinase n=1 Tax=Alkaliphilus peptidifermentans DSM 18978 TaxID=1120976 RepID=A0A1G5CV55_9FIRM|nr:dephospho-CoA kinase [Alkaliphilus peptidifermentans]SCY06264.1 dephospho-CoA kinase [Alkaliphilus peptidifermentans DSM 18978]